MKKIFYALLAAFFLLTTISFAQNKLTINGKVSNEKGNPLSGVKVEVFETQIKTTTGPDGSFSITGLNPGEYRILFIHPDYMPGVLEITVSKDKKNHVELDLSQECSRLLNLKNEITVTAEADSFLDVSLPSHRTIITDKALSKLATSNIAETVAKTPGVTIVGKGGYSMVPAIRGLDEHRILLLVDGVRIRSERRMGASASFVNVNNIARLEVNRGPYSVFYGSGAIGGIINILTKSPSSQAPISGNFQFGYNTVRDEKAASVNLSGSKGKFGFMLSANGKKASDYSSPSSTIKQSHYSDYDIMFKINREEKNSRFYFNFFTYQGIDVGKPSPTSEFKPRWYPREKNTLLTLGCQIKNVLFLDNFNAGFYFFPSLLETKKENLRETYSVEIRNLAKIEASNFGFKLRGGKNLGELHTLNFGIDFFGRAGINDKNTEWQFDEAGNITGTTEETSLLNSRRNNIGIYIDDKFHISSHSTLNFGIRGDYVNTSNQTGEGKRMSRDNRSISGYIGSVFQLTPHFSFLANIGSSFRFPTISELFYSGLTGRGTISANTDLSPERSVNLDFGIRYLHDRLYASIYAFNNTISDIIQKYKTPETDAYFYKNLTQGRIYGLEGEFYFWVFKELDLQLSFHHLLGKNTSDRAFLNYIPQTRLTLGAKYDRNNFWFESKIVFSAAKKNPGPLEIEIDGYTLVDTVLGYKVNKNIQLIAAVSNMLNTTYRASADEQGVDAPGRGFIFKASYSF